MRRKIEYVTTLFEETDLPLAIFSFWKVLIDTYTNQIAGRLIEKMCDSFVALKSQKGNQKFNQYLKCSDVMYAEGSV